MEKKTLYQMLTDTLEQRILEGRWTEDEVISSESELEREFGVSNITVRRALGELERKGMITRVKGKGSFVRPKSALRPLQPPQGGQGNIVSLIVPFESSLDITMHILQGLTEVLDGREYILNVVNSESGAEKERELLQELRKTSCGILLYPMTGRSNLDVLCAMAAAGYPFVLLDKNCGQLPFWSVESDNRGGAFAVTEYLIGKGHRNIAFFSHIPIEEASTAADRFLGYAAALARHGIPVSGDLTLERGKGAPEDFGRLLRYFAEKQVTAVVCTYDALAAELIRAAAAAQVPVPGALSVTGFDNLVYAEHLAVPLTTVNQNMREMGRRAASLLLELIAGREPPHERAVLVPTGLVERESVRTLPDSRTV